MTELIDTNPADLTIRANIRDVTDVPRDLVASIRERGVLEPITVYRDHSDGHDALVVVRGHRRTLAAQQAGADTVPAIVIDQPDDADRLIDQMVENEHRTNLTTTERIAAVEQMTLIGLSAGQIAKRAALRKTDVQTAIAASKATTSRDQMGDLTLDQAAALTEFEDTPDHVALLLDAATRGQFDHAAARLRVERADTARIAALTADLTAAGTTVIEAPDYGDDTAAKRLSGLTDDPEPGWNAAELDPAQHTGCPGHVAWIDRAWGEVYTDHDGTPLTTDDVDARIEAAHTNHSGDAADAVHNADEIDLDDLGIHTTSAQVPRVVYGCSQWRQHHRSRYPSSATTGSSRTRVEDMTETERDQARENRRRLIANNKAWDAATDVRRDWLTQFATRKTAPTGAETYIAAALVAHHTPRWGCLAVLGLDAHTLTAELNGCTAKRALQIALITQLAAWENETSRDTWRRPTDRDRDRDRDRTTLTALQQWGYTLSDVETQTITPADPGTPADSDSPTG